ncbi:hypothetical protein CC78DRAFT_577979 [Lojkania enalia]|uniref:F-box domain-containing protein n=1 Tax=Lojkania enalia TaxID=147567 RepID=A0A9P4N575_9PLEO|nr:hypothetical protein CC78DRAFT_577979 [Didymosphaeria enalia]
MPRLLDIPAELLDNIVSNFKYSSSTDTAPLISLCRTCRRLRNVAQPILHTLVKIHIPRDSERGYISKLQGSLWCFTSTILSRPDLARKVKALSIPTDPEMSAMFLMSREKEFLEHFFPTNCPGIPKGGLREISLDDLAWIILSRLENLEEVHFNMIKLPPPRALIRRIATAREMKGDNEDPLLASLKKLFIESQNFPFNIADFDAILLQSQLQAIHLKICIASRAISFGKALCLAPKVIHITELVLEDCYMRNGCLRGVLKACSRLKVLKYSAPKVRLIFLGIDLRRAYSFTPKQLVKALEDYNDSLEELVALFEDRCLPNKITDYTVSGLEDGDHWVYPSLHKLKQLTSLKVEYSRLLGPAILPNSLEKLHLTRCEPSIFLEKTWIRDIASMKQSWCSRLEEVTLRGFGISEATLWSRNAPEIRSGWILFPGPVVRPPLDFRVIIPMCEFNERTDAGPWHDTVGPYTPVLLPGQTEDDDFAFRSDDELVYDNTIPPDTSDSEDGDDDFDTA